MAGIAYLNQHQITPVLNAAVNDLAREAPAEPFDFLINALLKAAKALAARAPMRICAFEA